MPSIEDKEDAQFKAMLEYTDSREQAARLAYMVVWNELLPDEKRVAEILKRWPVTRP